MPISLNLYGPQSAKSHLRSLAYSNTSDTSTPSSLHALAATASASTEANRTLPARENAEGGGSEIRLVVCVRRFSNLEIDMKVVKAVLCTLINGSG